MGTESSKSQARSSRLIGITEVRCPVCLETGVGVALVPCGHCVCRRCASSLRNSDCPCCRRRTYTATDALFLDMFIDTEVAEYHELAGITYDPALQAGSLIKYFASSIVIMYFLHV